MSFKPSPLAFSIALVFSAGAHAAPAGPIVISTPSTSKQTLSGEASLQVTASGSITASDKTVALKDATSGAGVVVDNSGQITASNGRAIESSGSTATTRDYRIYNRAGASISASDDAVRVKDGFDSGSLLLDNAGSIRSTTGQALDALSLGEAQAESLGVDLTRLRIAAIAGTALAVGAATSVTGAIGFIGLVAPHLARPFVGYQPSRILLPATLGGALLLLIADIAARQDISLSYLEQLFAKLRRGGLVTSVRGPGGGYRLSRPSGELRIADIILAVDEPITTTRCKPGGTKGCTKAGARCVTHDLWEELGQQIHVFLSSVSLADVVDRKVLGRSKPCNDMNALPDSETAAA